MYLNCSRCNCRVDDEGWCRNCQAVGTDLSSPDPYLVALNGFGSEQPQQPEVAATLSNAWSYPYPAATFDIRTAKRVA